MNRSYKGIVGSQPASKAERAWRAIRRSEREKRRIAHEQLTYDQRRARLEKRKVKREKG